MELALGAIVGAIATAVIGPLTVAGMEVRRHDRQVAQRDDDLEEWMIARHRGLKQRFRELQQQAIERGVEKGSSIPAGQTVVRTLLLYDYREELRQARAFVLNVEVEERWTHRLMRRVMGRRFPTLTTPDRAERLIDYWSEGTSRNALTWSLDDILGELPDRATSRAREPEA